jgi:membrane associated rhomboid family serine protease
MSRFQFSVPPRRGPDDGWFRIGTFDVGTTVLVVGMAVVSMIVYAADKTLLEKLVLFPADVRGGQIWRLVTWPIVNEPDFFVAIMLAVFWMFGRDLERVMGRLRYTWFLVALTLIPAVLVTIVGALSSDIERPGFVVGLRFVELGVFVAFVARYPTARFFFGIPGWVIGAVFVGLDVLRFTGDRYWLWLLMLVFSCATALLGVRSMGYADEATWIPKLPLPVGADRRRAPRPKRRRGESSGGSTVVSGPWSGSVPDFVDQEEIDRLLDKVAASGLASLTKDERARLEAASRRKR